MSTPPAAREREPDAEDEERYQKRVKLDEESASAPAENAEAEPEKPCVLPPSHKLLGVPAPVSVDGRINFSEKDVGISEYVGKGVSQIDGIIKQRFTDFLVYEVDQDGNVIHLKSLAMPSSSSKDPPDAAEATASRSEDVPMDGVDGAELSNTNTDSTPGAAVEEKPPVPEEAEPTSTKEEPWPESFTTTLSPYFSEDGLAQLKQMFLEGPEPPRVSDGGWAGRQAKVSDGAETPTEALAAPAEEASSSRGRRGRDRGGRGGRGRGRGGGRGGSGREDHRRAVSNPISEKSARTALHQAIRKLFKGKLDTETDTTDHPDADDGSKIVVKWGRSGGRGGRGGGRGGGGGGDRPSRGNFPPYIHFTLQKTNRDTQDALGHLARILHVNGRDLSVAGTKDKRGVTVQRVSLKRNGKTVEDIWRLANGQGKKAYDQATKQRAERGVRIADFIYRKTSLELGMLKGNAFVITLRNVQVDSMETLDKAMNTLKNGGFINYYGMQRFGTASIPTHAIGLALLKSEWQNAISLIMQTRYGEHPDVEAARNAWLVEGNIDKALSLMPRRVVAERCILESYKKQGGETRNALGALSTIPRNLRLMYIHAYQSYVWNAIVSERVRLYGTDKPVVGDLVLEGGGRNSDDPEASEQDGAEESKDDQKNTSNREKKRSRKPYVSPKVKVLSEEDLNKYSIFDIVMPLPGTDVSYPGGALGERYREFLRLDDLDPDNFLRKQRDYTLTGSYRNIMHLPKDVSWSVLGYTDPDVALAQADEDKLLGFDSPYISDEGKFTALQIRLTLGTAAYATMALREVTKTDTSTHHQTSLTIASEDQKYRGVGEPGDEEADGGEEADVAGKAEEGER